MTQMREPDAGTPLWTAPNSGEPSGAAAMTHATRIEPSDFRRVLSHLPTGVALITAHGTHGPIGMAANSVTSVSLDPPLVLCCPARASTTWPQIRDAGGFCVNVMAAGHEGLTRRFAARKVDRFASVEYQNRWAGPALPDALAWIECRLEDEYDAGDHTIAVALVLAMEATTGSEEPLIFFRGAYGAFRQPSGK